MRVKRDGRSVVVSLFVVFLGLVLLLFGGSTAKAETCKFCSVPATKMASSAYVKLRLGVTNTTGSARMYAVDFYADTFDSYNRISWNGPLVQYVNPGQTVLFTYSWTPGSYFLGQHTLKYVVRDYYNQSSYLNIGSSPLYIVSSAYQSPLCATVGWIEPRVLLLSTTQVESDLVTRINEMHSLGMDTIVVAYVEDIYLSAGGAFYTSVLSPLSYECHFSDPRQGFNDPAWGAGQKFHIIDTIMTTAKNNGQKVILGLGRGPGSDDLAEQITTDLHRTTHWNFLSYVAQELAARYDTSQYLDANGNPTLYGWYLSHECGNFDANARAFYDGCCDILRQYGPEKPIMISPCPSSGWANFTQANIAASKVDIFAYQDGCGRGYNYNNGTCTYWSDTTVPQLANQFYGRQMAHSGTGKEIWANTEFWRMSSESWNFPLNPYAARVNSYQSPFIYGLTDQYANERPYATQIMLNEFLGCMKSPANDGTTTYCYANDAYNAYVSYYDSYKNW